MGRWRIEHKTESGRWRHYDWDDKYKDLAERDFFSCRHPTGDIASNLGTAEELSRRHAERESGEKVVETWVYDGSGHLHHKIQRR